MYNPVATLFKQVSMCMVIISWMASCTSTPTTPQPEKVTTPIITKNLDPHTFSKPSEVVVTHLDLDLKVDFDKKVLTGKASYDINNLTGSEQLVLDTRTMDIVRVTIGEEEKNTPFALGEEVQYLGQALQISIKPDTKKVHIYYNTKPEAGALQWLSKEQTAGKKHPFLFTQSQAILARTWVPCQDGPSVRFTYNATVEVPQGMLALMSAENPQEVSKDGKYSFKMEQAIPSYLLALAVGNLQFKKEGERTGVYAEPETLPKASFEFASMDDMLTKAEELYGPYQWGRYDVLVLPPSFPFGGMENPRLTFATPTILAGDRSLVSLVAHELAHSWSGNLVTNATWDDFWLNEGFTVYFERRIMEALESPAYSDMLTVLGHNDLIGTVAELGDTSPDTRLKLELEGRDPDDGVTDIAYEKGFFLLRYIEGYVGRAKFDPWIKEYFSSHAFKSMTTEAFLVYLDKTLFRDDPDAVEKLAIKDWIYKPGLPSTLNSPQSVRFGQVDKVVKEVQKGKTLSKRDTANWTTHEWLRFIRTLGPQMKPENLARLDLQTGFTRSENAEIGAAWFTYGIAQKYSPAVGGAQMFLARVGRRKFVMPLFKGLIKAQGKDETLRFYLTVRNGYHAVTRQSVDELLGYEPGTAPS